MSIGALRSLTLGLIALGALSFLDAPLRTLGQSWQAQRPRERLVLLMFELDLYALWAIAVFYLRWVQRPHPAATGARTAALHSLRPCRAPAGAWGGPGRGPGARSRSSGDRPLAFGPFGSPTSRRASRTRRGL